MVKMVQGFIKLVFFMSVLLLLRLDSCAGGNVGICYGRNADNLPPPDRVAQLIQDHNIKYVRIYDSNIQVLKAFANTGIELMIGVPNADLLAFSQFQSNVDVWLKNSILPYYPATKITYIAVGLEVTEAPNNASGMVVPAMQNVHSALKKAGLDKKIKVSSSHSLAVLSRSFPPSAGAFSRKHSSFLKPMLEFLAENDSPFMIDLYPYYAFRDSHDKISLEYALFESSSQVVDPKTGLLYTNLFDAQIDALYFAMMAANFRTVKLMVTETGWPTKGAPEETAAVPGNAQTYNTNLIRRVISDPGTPAKPGEDIDVYIFSLFNENRKPGMESERNWGLFYPNETNAYELDFTGKTTTSAPPTNTTAGTTNSSVGGTTATKWCVASPQATDEALKSALDWVCGPGDVDCSAIQPNQACYEPDTLQSHSSFAFNLYYQQNGAGENACSFGGAAVEVDKDPSYDNCMYMSATTTVGVGMNKTTTTTTTVNNLPAIHSPLSSPTPSNDAVRQVSSSVFAVSSMVILSFASLEGWRRWVF